MDREKLATYAHEAWSGWMKYMFEKSIRNPDGTVTIPVWAVERWERQSQMSYAKLPNGEKASDLVEADRMLDIVNMNKEQEKEVMEYLKTQTLICGETQRIEQIVQIIMRRYDLVPRGE